MNFRILAQDRETNARVGELETPHGVVRTPAFMPCATQATVKTLTPVHLEEAGVQMLLCFGRSAKAVSCFAVTWTAGRSF